MTGDVLVGIRGDILAPKGFHDTVTAQARCGSSCWISFEAARHLPEVLKKFVDCMISCEDGGNSGNRKIVYLSGKPPSPHRMKIKPRPSARLSGKISPARSTYISLLYYKSLTWHEELELEL